MFIEITKRLTQREKWSISWFIEKIKLIAVFRAFAKIFCSEYWFIQTELNYPLLVVETPFVFLKLLKTQVTNVSYI